MGDPVSWFLIRSGWQVVSADGQELGRVDEVAGDDTQDIFDGLAVAASALGKPRYVPAEQVGAIEEGVVHLTITQTDFAGLGEYLEPATTVRIQPDDRRGIAEKLGAGLHEIESKIEPPQKHAHPINLWRRLWLYFRRGGLD